MESSGEGAAFFFDLGWEGRAGLQRLLEPARDFRLPTSATMLKNCCARLIHQLPLGARENTASHQKGPSCAIFLMLWSPCDSQFAIQNHTRNIFIFQNGKKWPFREAHWRAL